MFNRGSPSDGQHHGRSQQEPDYTLASRVIGFMINRPWLSRDFDCTFDCGGKHAFCRFASGAEYSGKMLAARRIWSKGRGLEPSARGKLPVESLGHCQSIGNWAASVRGMAIIGIGNYPASDGLDSSRRSSTHLQFGRWHRRCFGNPFCRGSG